MSRQQKSTPLRKALQECRHLFRRKRPPHPELANQLNNAEAALNDMNRELDENERAIKEGRQSCGGIRQ